MTGPALGRPKSATFRTLDITGLDVLAHVARNLAERVPAGAGGGLRRAATRGRADFARLDWRKSGPGLLQARHVGRGIRDSDARSGDAHLSCATVGALRVDRAGQEHRRWRRARPRAVPRERQGRRLPPGNVGSHAPLRRARRTRHRSLARRCRSRDVLGLRMGARTVRDLADAIGLRELVEATSPANVPPLVAERLAAWARTASAAARACRRRRACCSFARSAAMRRLVRKNAGASLVDLGDGVLGVELHSKMNALGGDTVAMLASAVKEAEQRLRRPRRLDRRGQLLGRREPDAAPRRSAGGQLGRGGSDGPIVPARDDGPAPVGGAGGRRAGGPDARRRLRARAPRRSRPGRGRSLPGSRRSRRRV